MESSEVRLARMEERQKAHGQATEDNFQSLNMKLDTFIASQGLANKEFWEVRSKVIIMEAKRQGGVAAIALFSSVAIGTAAVLAWLFEQREAIMSFIRGKS
jgi:hypothetical protein